MHTPLMARPITPLDLPLVHRMLGTRLSLDMCSELTRGAPGLEETLLSAVPLAGLGAPTFVLRNGEHAYVGQFRQRPDRVAAQMTFLAPAPQDEPSGAWVTLLEAMTFEAGKRGAHLLSAEVHQQHPSFRVFRQAGFAVYARQVILQRPPQVPHHADKRLVRPETPQDAVDIATLQANTVPRLLQQAEERVPATGFRGLVYEQDGAVVGYLALAEGKSGVVIKPYFHPEAYDRVAEVVSAALHHIPRVAEVPVYVYVRAYQDWLRHVLEQIAFEVWAEQALMVKYTAVPVGRVQTAPLPEMHTRRLSPPVTNGPLPTQHATEGTLRTWHNAPHIEHSNRA